MGKKISIIGGDLRIVKLAEMLVDDGYKVYTHALDTARSLKQNGKIEEFDKIEDAVEKADVVIGPIPLSSNKRDINTPFSEKNIPLEELFSKINNKLFIAGNISDKAYELAEKNNVEIIDILAREELAVLNTISTAEGAIQIAIQETERTLHGSKVLVMGYGRVGKILSKMLFGLGAKVYCEARKTSDLAWIRAYGYEPIELKNLRQYLSEFDIIINTIPVLILGEDYLKDLNKDCLIIDLASNPGGVDKAVAKKLGIKTIWALSLPGKVAPITSAQFIKDTIYNILNERNNK